MNNSRGAANRALERVFRQREHLHVIDWADEHFWLPPASSNNKGMVRWKTYGYQKLALHAACDLDTYTTVVKKPTQVGMSKVALIILGYESAHRNRANGIWLPTRSDANTYSNVQISDMLEHVAEVRSQLKVDFDKKDKDNTTRRRSFKGAQSYCQATQTLQDVSSIPVEHALCDESSKYPQALKGGKDSVGKSPLDGIKGRLDSANDPCFTVVSTPTEHGVCHTTREFDNCREQFHRGYFCPSCDEWHVFDWGDDKTEHGFKWIKQFFDDGTLDNLETAKTVYYQCPNCEHKHYYQDLEDLDENRGEWRSDNLRFCDTHRKYYCLKTGDEMPSPYSVGTQLRGWFNRRKAWWRGVYDFLEALQDLSEGKPQKLVDWTQDYLAIAYRPTESAEYVKHGYLMAKQKDNHYIAECPDDVQMITKFWDVQGDRIECLTNGWGPRRECWLLKHEVYWGDPQTSQVLAQIQRHTELTYKKSNGFDMPVFLSGIDAKYLPDRVNEFCAGDYKFKIIPTMGSKSLGKPVIQGRTQANKDYGTFLTTLCPDTAKDIIYKMYVVEEPGPGYVHIPEIECFDEKFIKQMVIETKKVINGVLRWQCPDGVRNEALDLMCGNLAMNMMAQQRFGFSFVPKSEYTDAELIDEDDDMSITELVRLQRS